FAPTSFCGVVSLWFLGGCAGGFSPAGVTPVGVSPTPSMPRYARALTLGPGVGGRFNPPVIDVNGDSYPDLVSTARGADRALYIWLGDGKTFAPVEPTWTDIGYAALATAPTHQY